MLTEYYNRWQRWYRIPENRKHVLAYKKQWRKNLRELLIKRKGSKYECNNPKCGHDGICGSTENLELHEPDGNTDKHSSGRLTKMRDGLIEYDVLCAGCHSLTPNYRTHNRGKGIRLNLEN